LVCSLRIDIFKLHALKKGLLGSTSEYSWEIMQQSCTDVNLFIIFADENSGAR